MGEVIVPHEKDKPKGEMRKSENGKFWFFPIMTKTGKVIKKYIHIK